VTAFKQEVQELVCGFRNLKTRTSQVYDVCIDILRRGILISLWIFLQGNLKWVILIEHIYNPSGALSEAKT